MNMTRTYNAPRRAQASAANRERVLQAAIDLGRTRRIADISLDDVATAASVTVKTVLRQFGSRASLFAEAGAAVRERISQERQVPSGDLADIMRVLVDHYEAEGRVAVRLLAQESDDAVVAEITAAGRQLHRQWISETFADALLDAADSDELVNLLVVACDVYTWKLLRLDRHLSRARTEHLMTRLVAAIVASEEEK